MSTPFPIRGVAGGWRDPWDDDPLAAIREIRAMRATRPAFSPPDSQPDPHLTVPDDLQQPDVDRGDLQQPDVDRSPQRRHLIEAGVAGELLAHPRKNGRWEARVIALNTGWPPALWPSATGSTASGALDALEAELRAVIRVTLPESPAPSSSS